MAAGLFVVGLILGGARPTAELGQARIDLTHAQEENSELETDLSSTEDELEDVSADYDELQDSFDSQVAEITRETKRLEAQLERRMNVLDKQEESLSERSRDLRAKEADVRARERKLNIIEQSSFGDGTWRVGADITPGTYRAAGGSSCYWAILNSADNFDISSNAVSVQNPTVTLVAGKWFETDGCGKWRKIG